ncbi:hypothetical protein [Saccharopolyspora griseoalba]|uniref:Uncharacterized protein n=1 Tax=Saccharopolyspora griseoalba TaxID=1431848 RepID=A0ABW2LBD8_9PSEU
MAGPARRKPLDLGLPAELEVRAGRALGAAEVARPGRPEVSGTGRAPGGIIGVLPSVESPAGPVRCAHRKRSAVRVVARGEADTG